MHCPLGVPMRHYATRSVVCTPFIWLSAPLLSYNKWPRLLETRSKSSSKYVRRSSKLKLSVHIQQAASRRRGHHTGKTTSVPVDGALTKFAIATHHFIFIYLFLRLRANFPPTSRDYTEYATVALRGSSLRSAAMSCTSMQCNNLTMHWRIPHL